MAITRTPLIDDDGSGTTGTILNNAWQTGLYNAIDAAIVPTYGSWTPVDASGAGLVFQPGTGGQWAKYGRLVFVWCQFLYPTTTDFSTAVVGGLPYIVRSGGGMSQGFGPGTTWHVAVNGQGFYPMVLATGVAKLNSDLSGGNFVASATYLTD